MPQACPITTAVAAMSEADKQDSFIFQAGRVARGRGRGRADREFRPGDRHFRRHFHDLRQADHERAGRYRAGGQRGAGGRLQAGRSGAVDQRRRRSRASPTCSVSSASAPASRSLSRSSAAVHRCTLKAVPAAQGDQGQFRQRPPARRARHQPFHGARRHQDRESRAAAAPS